MLESFEVKSHNASVIRDTEATYVEDSFWENKQSQERQISSASLNFDVGFDDEE